MTAPKTADVGAKFTVSVKIRYDFSGQGDVVVWARVRRDFAGSGDVARAVEDTRTVRGMGDLTWSFQIGAPSSPGDWGLEAYAFHWEATKEIIDDTRKFTVTIVGVAQTTTTAVTSTTTAVTSTTIVTTSTTTARTTSQQATTSTKQSTTTTDDNTTDEDYTMLLVAGFAGAIVVLLAFLLFRRRKPKAASTAHQVVQKAEPTVKPSEEQRFCTNCGTQIEARAKYCPFCGEKQGV